MSTPRLLNLNHVLQAQALVLTHEALPAAQVLAGQPTVGAEALTGCAGVAVGVWEIIPGVSTDVEAEEVFIVLSG